MVRRNASKLGTIVLLLSLVSSYACAQETIRLSSYGYSSTPTISCENDKPCNPCKDGTTIHCPKAPPPPTPLSFPPLASIPAAPSFPCILSLSFLPCLCLSSFPSRLSLLPDTCPKMVSCVTTPDPPKECEAACDSWIDQTLKSVTSLVGLEYKPKICFDQALRYSAETMGYLKPNFLDLGKLNELTLVRIWSWAQTLIGPFLFVMFSLALKNKLKR